MDDSIPKVAEYKRLRSISQRLASKLTDRVDSNSLHQAAETLGMMSRGVLVFSSENEMAILFDYCLYQQRVNAKNLVERYLEETPPDPLSEESAVLRADLGAYYSIFEITGVERGAGVYLNDLLRGETRFLSDIGMSNTASVGQLTATRVVPHPGGVLMTTGAAIGMTAQQFAQLKPKLQGIADLGTRELTHEQETALVTAVISQSLKFGFTSQIAYAEANAPAPRAGGLPSARPATSRRAGRNDPCPCGSGRKYKVCCGRA